MEYIVRPGDTLNAIAKSFQVSLASLLANNPSITNPALISVGMRVQIPDSTAASASGQGGSGTPGSQANGGGAGVATPPSVSANQIAWGAKVSAVFKSKVIALTTRLGFDPNYLMAAMAFESGESFSPSVKNAAGSGAVGLIQFMPATATALGTSTLALAAMTAEDQLDYVEAYFNPYRNRLNTLEDVYMAILMPVGIGKPNSYVLFTKGSVAYAENVGLDSNHDGVITKQEAAAAVRAKLVKGTQPGFLG